jgi:hypothetical protein
MLDAKNFKSLLNDTCNKSFFYSLGKTLNGSWMAANLISNTDIIKNDKKGIMLYIAGIIKISSDRIPIIGSGIKLFGEILKAVNKKKQAEMVNLLDNFVKD